MSDEPSPVQKAVTTRHTQDTSLKQQLDAVMSKNLIDGREAVVTGEKIFEVEVMKEYLEMLVTRRYMTSTIGYTCLCEAWKHYEPYRLHHIQKQILGQHPGAVAEVLSVVDGVGITEENDMLVIIQKCEKIPESDGMADAWERCRKCGKLDRMVKNMGKGDEDTKQCPLYSSILYFFNIIKLPPPNTFESLELLMFDDDWVDRVEQKMQNSRESFIEAWREPIHPRCELTDNRVEWLTNTECGQVLLETENHIVDFNLALATLLEYGVYSMKPVDSNESKQGEMSIWKTNKKQKKSLTQKILRK